MMKEFLINIQSATVLTLKKFMKLFLTKEAYSKELKQYTETFSVLLHLIDNFYE